MPDKIPELNLPPEIEGVSEVYDLKVENPIDTKDVGLAADVLNIAAIKIRDETIEVNFQQELNKIQQDIFDSIQSPNSGYLLEIVVYVDQDGFIKLPQGRLINPIGIGREPLDAMARYLNTDRMVPGGLAPRSYKNNSSLLWITKSDGHLSARSIPSVAYDKFLDLSNNEAKKRKLMGEWIALNDQTGMKAIQIAEFWRDKVVQNTATIQSQEIRNKIDQLTRDMRSLEDRANAIYTEFQKTQEEMVQCQKLNSTLNAISAVAGLIKSGIEVGTVLSSSDKPLKNGEDHLLSIEETRTLNDSRLTQLGLRNTQLTTTTKEYLDQIGSLHREFSVIFGEVVTPVPTLDDNPLLILPIQ